MAIRLSRRELLIAGSGLALAGCGGTAKGSVTAPPVVVWYETGLSIAPVLKTLIDHYNASGPVVPVLAQPQPDLGVKLLVVIGAHDAPNVVIYPRSRAWSLVSRGAAFPLTDFAHRDGLTGSVFPPAFWQGGFVKQRLWGLPIAGDATVLAYNEQLLTAAKVTPVVNWSTSAFQAACAALVKRDTHGHLVQTGAILDPGVPFPIWLWQQGADVLTADGKKPAFDNSAGLNAAKWLLSSQQINGGGPEVGRLVTLTTLTEGESGVFRHGKLGMLPTNYSGFIQLRKAFPQTPVHLTTVPVLDGGRAATRADVVYAFSPQEATAPQPEGSWQFMKWLATDRDAQYALYRAGSIPALTSVQQSPTLRADADAQLVIQALTVARNPQDFPWEPEVEAALGTAIQKALNGQTSPEQALGSASVQATHTIQQETALGE